MLFLVMLAIVFGVVAVAAVLGFLFALYALRPRLFSAFSASIGLATSLPVKVIVGLVLAVLIPVVAGLATAMTGAKWVTDILGHVSSWYWMWVASAGVAGIGLGLLLPHTET